MRQVICKLLVVLFLLGLCGCGGRNVAEPDTPTPETPTLAPTPSPEPTPPTYDVCMERVRKAMSEQDATTASNWLDQAETVAEDTSEIESCRSAIKLFDGTYWNLILGQTIGTQYFAKFSLDGTYRALTGSISEIVGTYTYQAGTLRMAVTDGYPSSDLEDAVFIQEGDGFRSTEKFEMMVGEEYFQITPTDPEMYDWAVEQYDRMLWETENSITIGGKRIPLDTTELDLSYEGELTNEDGALIGKLTGLTHLDLHGHDYITDLTPLAGLTKLTFLDLTNYYDDISSGGIKDISPLAGLTNLTELRLAFNQIKDISPLKNLVNLTSLDLGFNEIHDITPLMGLKNLKYVALYSNPLDDYQAQIARLREALPECEIVTYIMY